MLIYVYASTFLTMQVEVLKCPYYGFFKMIFHAVCNTALSEWKHPAKI